MLLVIKVSGKALDSPAGRGELCRQLAELSQRDHRLLVVHGGGKQLTELSRQLGIPTIQYEGRRVTDDATLQAAKMVFSALNADLVATLVSHGAPALGLAGFAAGIVRARKRPPLEVTVPELKGEKRPVDFGWVGEIEAVSTGSLQGLWSLGLLPVMSCLCADKQGQILNINADTLAAELAIALPADRLIGVSDVEGVYLDFRDPATRIPRLSAEEARRHLQSGRFTEGMIPKIESALQVLERGVSSVQIVSGIRPGALLEAMEEKAGTVLSAGDPPAGPPTS